MLQHKPDAGRGEKQAGQPQAWGDCGLEGTELLLQDGQVGAHLIDVNGFQSQLSKTLPAVPVALGGGGHAPAPGLAPGAMLEVHGETLGTLSDQGRNLWRSRGGW